MHAVSTVIPTSGVTLSAPVSSSEQRFRAIFEQAALGVAQVGPDGRWIDVNARLCAIVGYTREELLATTFQAITHPDDLNTDLDQVRRVLAGDIATYSMEKRYRRKGGPFIWANLTVSLVRDASGEPLYFISVVEDIDARKQAEARLAEAAANIKLMVKASNIGLWDWDLSTNKVHFSREWKGQLGYAEHEITDDFGEWEQRVHPDDLPPTLARLQKYLADPSVPHEVEFRMRHKNGSWRWIYARGEVTRDASGKAARMLGCHMDVTESKRLIEAAKASEAFLREAIDAMAASTALVGEDGRIVTVNRRWREFAISNGGGDNAVHEGLNYLRVCDLAQNEHPEAGRIGQMLRSVLAGESDPPPVEYACHSPTKERWFQAWVRGFNQGPKRYAVVSHEDVTDLRLVAMAKQREAVATIAAGVAHEFNSLLFAAAMQVHKAAPSGTGEAAAKAVDLIHQAQGLASALLNLYAGPETTRTEPIGLHPWLPETVARLATAFSPGIHIETEVEFDLPEAMAHRLALEQLVRNLLINAANAMGDTGEIRVRATSATVDGLATVEIRVSDDGPGIPEALRAKVFEPGFSTNARSYRTGLGLAIADRLLEQFGGSISFEPNTPKGSTFVIRLLARAEENP